MIVVGGTLSLQEEEKLGKMKFGDEKTVAHPWKKTPLKRYAFIIEFKFENNTHYYGEAKGSWAPTRAKIK